MHDSGCSTAPIPPAFSVFHCMFLVGRLVLIVAQQALQVPWSQPNKWSELIKGKKTK